MAVKIAEKVFQSFQPLETAEDALLDAQAAILSRLLSAQLVLRDFSSKELSVSPVLITAWHAPMVNARSAIVASDLILTESVLRLVSSLVHNALTTSPQYALVASMEPISQVQSVWLILAAPVL